MVSTVMKLVSFLYVFGKAQNRRYLIIGKKLRKPPNLFSGRGGWYSQVKVVEMLGNTLKERDQFRRGLSLYLILKEDPTPTQCDNICQCLCGYFATYSPK